MIDPTRQQPNWPSTTHVEVPWRTNPDQRGTDGRRPNHRDRVLASVVAEVPARIGEVKLDLSPELVEQCREAEATITRLDSGTGAHLSGMPAFLIRSESAASSRIERVYANLDDVARASIREEATESARKTALAAEAMSTLIDNQEPGTGFDETVLLAAHRTLLDGDPHEGEYAGRYRDVQNWLGGSDFSPRGALHVPPPPEHVQQLMTDLTAFVNRNDMPPLVQVALAHGQFEAIHPFTDGNGRIGRGLIAVTLRRRAVTRKVVVPIASVMLTDVDSYFEALIAYRDGEPRPLVSLMVEASVTAAEESEVSAERLAELPARWRNHVRPRKNSSAFKLLDGLLERPVLNAQVAQEVTGSSAPRTYEALDRLTEAGVLSEITGSGRNRVWTATDVFDELADLDERIGQRSQPSKRWR